MRQLSRPGARVFRWQKTPTGSMGHVLRRNSPGLANIAYYSTLSWANDGITTLEDLLPVPIRGDNPIELGVTERIEAEVLLRFDSDPTYQALFQSAFPDSSSGATINRSSSPWPAFAAR